MNLKAVICPEYHHVIADAGEFKMALGKNNSSRRIHFNPLCLAENRTPEIRLVLVGGDSISEVLRHLTELVLGMEHEVSGRPGQARPLQVLGRFTEFISELRRNRQTLFGIDHGFGLSKKAWSGRVCQGVELCPILPHFASRLGDKLRFCDIFSRYGAC